MLPVTPSSKSLIYTKNKICPSTDPCGTAFKTDSLAYNLQTCFLNLFSNKGILFASFHSKGRVPSCSDMLNTCANGVLICSAVSFSILGDIPSTPGDLFSFILLILLATTSGVTSNYPNLSPSDPLNVVPGTGNEQVSSLVNTELKCIFNSSAIKNPFVIIFPALSSSGPTLSRTFCLLLTYAYKLLLSDFIFCVHLCSTFRLDFLTSFVAAFSASL